MFYIGSRWCFKTQNFSGRSESILRKKDDEGDNALISRCFLFFNSLLVSLWFPKHPRICSLVKQRFWTSTWESRSDRAYDTDCTNDDHHRSIVNLSRKMSLSWWVEWARPQGQRVERTETNPEALAFWESFSDLTVLLLFPFHCQPTRKQVLSKERPTNHSAHLLKHTPAFIFRPIHYYKGKQHELPAPP